jgi:hypothetical protein
VTTRPTPQTPSLALQKIRVSSAESSSAPPFQLLGLHFAYLDNPGSCRGFPPGVCCRSYRRQRKAQLGTGVLNTYSTTPAIWALTSSSNGPMAADITAAPCEYPPATTIVSGHLRAASSNRSNVNNEHSWAPRFGTRNAHLVPLELRLRGHVVSVKLGLEQPWALSSHHSPVVVPRGRTLLPMSAW